MIHISKKLLVLSILLLGLLSCSNEDPDPRVEKVGIEIQPSEPIVYDFDYKYQDKVGEIVTLSKNYFQANISIKNDNTDYGIVVVGFSIEATSSSTNGGIKTDNISISPVDEPPYLLFATPSRTSNYTINVGNLNPKAQGLSYSIKLIAKGYISDPVNPAIQIDRFSREFFFNAR